MNKLKTALLEAREYQSEEPISAAKQPKAKQQPNPTGAVAEPKVLKDEPKSGKGEESKGLPNPAAKATAKVK
jgi:hypothetical protein